MAVAARITAIDGRPIDSLGLRDFNRRFLRTRSVTEIGEKPPDTDILHGSWWAPADVAAQVCVNEETAKILHLVPGSEIDWGDPGLIPPQALVRNAAISAGQIVVDDRYVYWVDKTWIGRVAK